MKKSLSILTTLLLSCYFSLAQTDSLKPVEPNKETSYDNQELLIIALVGLALLLVLYFFFRRTRRFRR